MINEKDIVAVLFLISLMIAATAGMYGFFGQSAEKHFATKKRLTKLTNRDIEKLKAKYKEEKNPSVRAKVIFQKVMLKLGVKRKTTEEQDKNMRELSAQLYSAGINMDAETYTFLQNGVALLCIVIGIGLVFTVFASATLDIKAVVILLAFIIPVMIFKYGLKARIASKKEEIEKQLPNVLDLLSISVEAGMGFDQALNYITHEMSGPLVDELIVVAREMSLGKSRKEAFDGLSERTAIESVKNFSSEVVQATEMGLPLKNVLVSQAESVRAARFSAIKAKAAQASIKMLVPMVVFIFPVLIIVLMGPALLNMMDSGLVG